MKPLIILGLLVSLLALFKSNVHAETLDQRLGVNHQGPSYPIRGSRTLPDGAKEALNLGFQTIEIYIGMGMCWQTAPHPNGLYQTYDFCDKDLLGKPLSTTKNIIDYVQNPLVTETLDLPFKTIIIDTDASLSSSANAQHLRILEHPLPAARLQGTYTEFYNLSSFILNRYNGQSKTFILSTPNELDWQMLPTADPTLDPSDATILNARDYLNTISQAVQDAKRDNPTLNVELYHACEANLLQKAKNGGKTAVNDVFPYTHCDLYGYSAYDAVALDSNQSAITDILDYYSSKVPDSPDFGNKNIYVSEISGATNYTPPELASTQVTRMNKALAQSLAWGVPYFNFWQLYSNCSVENPENPTTECIANWLVKPNGDKSEVYNQVFLPKKITVSPSPAFCLTDINSDGRVDLRDYSLLAEDFLKPVLSNQRSDINSDGRVDLRDYSLLAEDFLKGCG